ncbi:hypothetical protein T03_16217, partial [Trichinella britovi]
FDAWKSEHFHTFRVASSETLRLKDGVIDPIFRYRYIVYHCAHYGVPRVRGMSQNRKYNYLPCGCSAMLRLNYSCSERTLRITTLHEEHTGHDVSAQAYKEFLEKSKRFGPRQNPENVTRRFSAPLPSTTLTSCHTLEALLNRNDSPLSDKENDPATVESAAEDSVVIEDGVEKNEEKVELSSSPRTDEERFQIIHAVLQGLCDNLLESEDAELDEKLAQLSALHSQWREMNFDDRRSRLPCRMSGCENVNSGCACIERCWVKKQASRHFTVSNIIKMDGLQDEKSSTSENVPCSQSSVESCSISEERSILLSQAAIMDVVENLRTSNKRDGGQSLIAKQTWPNISGFQVGRRFRSFLEFEQAFDAWKSEHFHTFRVASSETLRLKDGVIDPIFRYRWSERTLRITTLHEEHTGHAVSAQAYKEFLEKSKRFGSRQNPANKTRRFSALLPSTALTNCHTLEALLNPNDSPLSDKENDPAAVESAAGDSVVIEDGVETNEEKVELSSSPRTDEERFQIIHAVLHGICDNLLESEDAELDEKLAQLAILHSQWREMNL